MYLALHEQGIDLTPTVVNRYEARNLRVASLFVYLDHADMRTKGEDAGLRLKENGRLQARLDTWSQCIGEVCRSCHISEGDSFLR